MKKDWSTIEVLKHSRHDWLNKIQLIKGNIALNKMDRVKSIIEEIVIDAQNETHLTNLQIPSFACLMMTYNWEPHKCQLDFEVLGNTRDLSNFDNILTDWCQELLSLLEDCADEMAEHNVSITFDSSEEETRFFFDFSGILKESEKLSNWLQSVKDTSDLIQLKEFKVCKEEVNVLVHIG